MENNREMVSPQTLEDVSKHGQVLYATRLKAQLEPQYCNQYIALHVDSGDYAVAKTTAAATRELLRLHPIDGRIYLRKIGDAPEYELAAQILAGEMREKQER